MAAALSWAVSHAEGRVTQSIRSASNATIYEFATHTRGNFVSEFAVVRGLRVIQRGAVWRGR